MASITYVASNRLFGGELPLWKRSMDILGSIIGLAVSLPIFAVVALYIKCVSPGPVFFKSKRVGFNGEQFIMWKFRSMHIDGDSELHKEHMTQIIAQAGNPVARRTLKPMVKLDSNDPRLIPFASVIRKTCIDEIPQLINVLRGEMSLVGPRPAIEYEAREYCRWHFARLDVVPGMTGLWQVSGKNRLTFREMVALDIRYSRERSILLDTKILILTVPAICRQLQDYQAKRAEVNNG